MGESARLRRLAAVKGLFAAQEDPYAGADLGNAKRLGAAMWVIGAGISLVLLPFAPPTEAIGRAGWAAAAGLVLLCLVGSRSLMSRGAGFDELLAANYLAVAQIATIQWLAGGSTAPYDQLYLLSFLYCGAVHPPRRAAACLGVASLAFLAPLAYDAFAFGALFAGLTQLLIWWGIAMIAMALMVGVRRQRLEGQAASREARVDALTALGNRRAFEEALGREGARARRSGDALALILLDIDAFKQINDRYGHPAGDACLRRVAEALRLTVRAHDLCFRWGGDEFAVLLPATALERAEDVAARVSATVEAAALGPEGALLTIGCGVACLSDSGDPEQLVADADMALLLAKRAARA